MFKKILLGLVVVIILAAAGLAIGIAMQPDELRIERKATFAATPAEVFPHLNDFHNWQAWSPWAKLDPAAKNEFEGPSEGPGAIFTWSGNDKVGAGKMTILETRPNEYIKIKLDFFRPQPDTCTTEFTCKAEGDRTVVTWNMVGKNTLKSKAVQLVVNIEKMVGDSFEEGLANLKTIVETPAKK